MAEAPKKNQVFNDFAAFLNALLPQSAGFIFHDRHGKLFWHDGSPDTSQLNDAYRDTLTKMLRMGPLEHEEARIPLAECTAYLIEVVSDQEKVLGVLTALVPKDTGGMPYTFCCDLLQPAVRSMARELSLRYRLLKANTQLESRSNEYEFYQRLGTSARKGDTSEESLGNILQLALKHLLLDGAVIYAPALSVEVSTGPNPIDNAEAALLLEKMNEHVDRITTDAATALTIRPTADPRDRSRTWPILEDGKNLIGILVLSRPANMAKLGEQSESFASFLLSTIEQVLERGFDPVTRTSSWQSFETELTRDCDAGPEAHSVIYMDLDQLQVVNDNYGQQTGDDLLKQFAALVRELVPNHLITRVGGDRFAALLRDTDINCAENFGNQLCSRFKDIELASADAKLKPSVSVGVAALAPSAEGARSLLLPAQMA
jgi:diguanylate cyclase (GGDEF)-like protein